MFWLLCDERIFFSGPIYLVFNRLLVPLWTSLPLGCESFLLWFCWGHFQVLWVGNLHSSLFQLISDFVYSLCPEFPGCIGLGVFMFWVFDIFVNLSYSIFYTWDSLFRLLSSIGDTYIFNMWPLSWNFPRKDQVFLIHHRIQLVWILCARWKCHRVSSSDKTSE